MTVAYSDALLRFKTLIKSDYKNHDSKKKKEERMNLLEWYVHNCPSNRGPEKSKKFADYGIKSGADYKELKSQIISSIGLKKNDTYIYCSNGKEMENLIDKIENVYSSRRKAIIYFSNGEYKEMDSLYIRIRNSFAHGNHFKFRDYYYLWNETGSKQKKLGSFMVLKYEHLKSIYNALDNH